MYNDNDFDRNDALGQRLQRIGGQMNPSPQLKKAAKTGVLLRPMAKSYTAGTHIRKFTKAVLLYAACIALFLGAILLIPKWFGGNEPTPGASVDPIITSKPTETTVPPVTEECKHLWVTSDNTPSCTEGCYKYAGCDLCGLSSTAWLDALGHDFADGICTRCGEAEEVAPLTEECQHDQDPATCPYCACDEHVWITSEDSPTCTEGITKVSTCIKCGYSFAEWQDPIPHDYVDGNCTMCGKTDGTLPPLEITIPIPDPGEMSAELEAEIIAASAKQYDEDPKDLSVEFVADLGSGAYAIFLDGPWEYPCMETEQIVHGYLFWYSSGRTMSIYKDGVVYGLTKAYEKGVIDANQVLDLYLVYADQMGYLSVRNPEKMYSNTTLGYHFVDNQICIWVFSAYNSYQYTANDFSEINCIELYESPWQNYEDGKSFRRILLTLDKNSKQYVLDCIQILQLRVDIQAADVNTLEDAE